MLFVTNPEHYEAIADALRAVHYPSTQQFYPKDMHLAIRDLPVPNKYKLSTTYDSEGTEIPPFDCLIDALMFYDGTDFLTDERREKPSAYATTMAFGIDNNNTLAINPVKSTDINSCYYALLSGGASFSAVNTVASGVKVNYAWSGTNFTVANPRLVMYPNALAVASRASTYNGSTTVLQELSIENASYISHYTFQSCYQLKSVYAPKCCTVNNNAFNNCINLQNVYLASDSVMTTLGTRAFNNTGIKRIDNKLPIR